MPQDVLDAKTVVAHAIDGYTETIPMDIALSGYLAPVKNMPALFAALAQVSPLQHYLVAIRSIMLKGAGLDVLWPQALALILIGLVIGTIAVRTATRRLE